MLPRTIGIERKRNGFSFGFNVTLCLGVGVLVTVNTVKHKICRMVKHLYSSGFCFGAFLVEPLEDFATRKPLAWMVLVFLTLTNPLWIEAVIASLETLYLKLHRNVSILSARYVVFLGKSRFGTGRPTKLQIPSITWRSGSSLPESIAKLDYW